MTIGAVGPFARTLRLGRPAFALRRSSQQQSQQAILTLNAEPSVTEVHLDSTLTQCPGDVEALDSGRGTAMTFDLGSRWLKLGAAVTAVCSVSSELAFADFRVCNKLSNRIDVAIGHANGNGTTVRGWTLVGANDCETIIKGDLKWRYYYLYARHPNGSRAWPPRSHAMREQCIRKTGFSIDVGKGEGCPPGFSVIGYGELDTGRQSTSYTLSLD